MKRRRAFGEHDENRRRTSQVRFGVSLRSLTALGVDVIGIGVDVAGIGVDVIGIGVDVIRAHTAPSPRRPP
eukprot:8692590-Pyramimonas_sp.AAC.1